MKLGRQTALGRKAPAGTGRAARPDPLALPVRFAAPDATADGQSRQIEIDRDGVLLSRRLHGMAIRVRLADPGERAALAGRPGLVAAPT